MTWKKLNNHHTGRAHAFGGDDLDKISGFFDGTSDVDTVDINSQTTIRSSKLRFSNPVNTFSYTILPSAITADRDIFLLFNDASSNTFVMVDAVQTLTNKTFTSCTFDASNAAVTKFAGDPSLMRWGAVFPQNSAETTTGVAALEGILSRHTIRNPSGNPSCVWFSTPEEHGYFGQSIKLVNTASSGEYCGLISPTTGVGLFRMSHAGLLRLKFSQQDDNASALWFGLSSSSAAPLSAETPLTTSQSGILIGNSPAGESGYRVRYHNGDGSAVTDEVIVSGETIQMGMDIFRTFEIKWYNDGSGLHATASVSNSPLEGLNTYTKAIVVADGPASSTDLYLHCHLINTTASSKYFNIASMWAESI